MAWLPLVNAVLTKQFVVDVDPNCHRQAHELNVASESYAVTSRVGQHYDSDVVQMALSPSL